MKKVLIIVILLTMTLFSANAQGFYFDIGLGVGGGWTKLDGEDVGKELGDSNITEIAIDLGLKAGYGPIANTPLYVVGVLGGIGHRFEDSSGYIQFNSYILGAGVIFYPIPLIQLAGSFGFSSTGNVSSFGTMYESKGGFAYDLSVAVDLGGGNHGCLIGVRYFSAFNELESRVEQNQSLLSVFVRYTFRHKVR